MIQLRGWSEAGSQPVPPMWPMPGNGKWYESTRECSRRARSTRSRRVSRDTCGKESFQKFPDYTADGALKRDAYMRDCLRKHHLPPRNDVAQPLPRSQ